ncbi:LCP family protein [Candidatus Saccharibacteria bacterium]|nr:LCP family protein [Candidatus Saccharibacteria bacterium]
MKNDKSIDGLRPRSAKKPATAKPVTKPTAKPAAKTAIKPAAKTSTKPVAKQPTKQIEVQTVDDFLKPVQAFDLTEGGELVKSKKTRKEKKAEKKAAKLEKKALKKPHKVRKIIAYVLLVIVLALIGLICWAVFWGNDIIAKITGGQGNVFDLIHWVDDVYDPLKTDANGRTNILAFGTSGYNMDGDEGYGVHDGAQLTDSIMAISLNQETGDIAMASLPRDLKASPTCTATGKINEVYWCNNMYGDNEEAGATALMAEVGSILGIEFQYYAHVNWGSLEQIVNIVDGITVVLDEDIEDYYYTGAVYQAGVEYRLDGAQAVGLSRARHGTVGGDFSRGSSQQKILIGIKNRVIERDFSITDYLSLASALGDNLRTNFSLSELKTLAHLTFDFDFDSMRQIPLFDPGKGVYLFTTGTINGISYVLPAAGVGNYGAVQAQVATLLSNDPRTYENPTILILNAKDEEGLAAAEKAKLEEAGYTVNAIDNTEVKGFELSYNLYALTNKPGTKQMLEKFYNNTYIMSASELPEGISRDYDFVIVIGPALAEEELEEETEEQ